jgi:enterochelin esterase-like enzyme
MKQPPSPFARPVGLIGPVFLACAAACSSGADAGAPGGSAGAPGGGTAPTSGGAMSQAAGAGGAPAAQGGAPATAGSAGTATSAGASSGGQAGTTGGGTTGGGTTGGGTTGGGTTGGGAAGGGAAGSPATTGSCPTSLPPLAADGDNSFYANRQGTPHGVVKEVQYKPGSGKTMHVYTPPDYDTNTSASYPVLYINHGGGESDVHWGCTNANNCGYAGRILDNLLADGDAVPMLIVMPDTGDCANFDPPEPPSFDDPCTTQYVDDFIPYVEKTYRVKAERSSRAIAGLSMGGLVTLTTGFAHLELFSHVFVYSSGYMADARAQWETNLASVLGDAKGTNARLNAPIYLAAGSTDNALPNSQAVRDIFKEHGIKVLWQDSSLGHEWANWRRYLAQTLPLMFKNTSGCD